MSETSGFPQYAGATSQMRTLAVRITDDLRAQLDVIAQLNDRSVTEEIRLSLEDWIERSKSDPHVLKRAETVRADIEREAQTKRNAIEAIFAKEPTKKATPPSRDVRWAQGERSRRCLNSGGPWPTLNRSNSQPFAPRSRSASTTSRSAGTRMSTTPTPGFRRSPILSLRSLARS